MWGKCVIIMCPHPQVLFDQSLLPPCMFNPMFNVFGIRIYLRDENTMNCQATAPAHGGNSHSNSSSSHQNMEVGKVTLIPKHNKKTLPGGSVRNTSENPGSPKYINSQNNVISDDVLGGRGKNGNHAPSFHCQSHLPCMLFFCLLVHVVNRFSFGLPVRDPLLR